jgi:hypothetical protein
MIQAVCSTERKSTIPRLRELDSGRKQDEVTRGQRGAAKLVLFAKYS